MTYLSANPAYSQTHNAQPEAKIVLALFVMRWLAGITENAGVPRLSEVAAIVMLAGLALMFLQRMRIAADVGLFTVGIVAWIMSGTLSSIANPGADLQATIALLTLLALYGLFANAAATYLQTGRGLADLSRVLGIFVVVGFALSLIQILSGTGFVEAGKQSMQRAFGSDVHPVSFAIQMLAALVSLEIVRLKQRRPIGPAHVVMMVIGALTLYLTFARTAWVMALMVIALAMILRGSPARRLFVAAVTGGFGLLLLLSSNRFADLGSLRVFLSNFSVHDVVFDWRFVDNSVSWRIVNWTFGLQQAMEKPWLGFGPGQSAVSSYFSLEMHNIFLEVFFEGGIFGLAALLITLAGLARLHGRLPAHSANDARCRILANGFGVALLFAVTFSTSFVDQLMSFLIYQVMVAAAGARSCEKSPAVARNL